MARILWLAALCVLLQSQAPSIFAQSLDYQFYKTRIEPIFLKVREANGPGGPCFSCHTEVTSRLRLQPLAPGAKSWTEEQSRRNFETVSKLVVPGEPAKSRLLLHPLSADAGGDPTHSGGKHWQSQNDPEWQALAAWVRTGSAASAAAPAPALDFQFFKSRVQPLFLDKRPGHARCYVCHSQGTNFRLQPLSPGATTWNEEESQRNFQAIQRLVVSGDPTLSRFLMMPLAEEAGGDPFHPGGKWWSSKDDPEWQMLASWVRGQPRAR